MQCYNCSTASLRTFLATVVHIDSQSLGQTFRFNRGDRIRPSFHTPLRLRQCKRALSVLQTSGHHASSNTDDPYIPFDSTPSSQDNAPRLPRSSSRTWIGRGNKYSRAQKLQEPLSASSQDKSKIESKISRTSSSDPQKVDDSLNIDHIKAFFNAHSAFPVNSKAGNVNAGPAVPKARKSSQSLPASKAVSKTTTGGHEREPWQIQKQALAKKFGSSHWAPRKRLSPDALEGIRSLHAQHPEKYTTPELARQFAVSPEAIRRILKSKWKPSEDEEADRRRRWGNRGEAIWSNMVAIGIKPPKKWREMGIGKDYVSGPKKKVRSASGHKDDVNQKPDYVLVEALSHKGGADVPTVPLSQRIL
ncbi:MAG: hypothetical protein Q9195_000662 [Heterodermia aff. obscurata]